MTGFDPLCPDSDGADITESVKLQLYGTVASLSCCAELRDKGEKPDTIACHSMGIYPALAASGSIDRQAALELTFSFGVALSSMRTKGEYALGCVTGMEEKRLAEIARKSGVFIANRNTSRHFLLAGEKAKIVAALEMSEASGAFSARIYPCDAPLHTPLLRETTQKLKMIASGHVFVEPNIPLFEPLTQNRLTAGRIPSFLVDEICRPVFWDRTYMFLKGIGVSEFTEIAFSPLLSKFNRWIDNEL